MGLPVAKRVMGKGVMWRYCWCAGCNGAPRFLYERPDKPDLWQCRKCHDLTYRAKLEKGTRAAMLREAREASGTQQFEYWLQKISLWTDFDAILKPEIVKRRAELNAETSDWIIEQVRANAKQHLRQWFIEEFCEKWKCKNRTFNRHRATQAKPQSSSTI